MRKLGLLGEDLKKGGQWLGIGAAIERAIALNVEAARVRLGGKKLRRPPASLARTCRALAEHWQQTVAWSRLAPRTQADYRNKLAIFLADFGEAPVRAVERHVLKGFWEALYRARGHAMANGVLAVVRAMFSHAEDIGPDWLGGRPNPALRLKLPGTEGRLVLWTPEEVAALVATADASGLASVGDAVVLALHSGQRQADVLALPERIVDDAWLRLSQAKTKARVDAPMTPALLSRLKAARLRARTAGAWSGDTIVTYEATGRAYQIDTFRHVFAGVRARAAVTCPSLADRRFQDLRDTAITRLALAGCDMIRICAISGHSSASVTMIMKHYLSLDTRMAREAIGLLTTWLEREGIAL